MSLTKSGYLGFGTVLGAAFGAAFGSAIHQMGALLPIGMGVGIIIASTMWHRSLAACSKTERETKIRTAKS